jgi:hypothetical protein
MCAFDGPSVLQSELNCASHLQQHHPQKRLLKNNQLCSRLLVSCVPAIHSPSFSLPFFPSLPTRGARSTSHGRRNRPRAE